MSGQEKQRIETQLLSQIRTSSMAALVLLMGVLLVGGRQCMAQAVPPRPQFPKSFDRGTVQHLLDTVEQRPNQAILKAGYFARRIPHALPSREGYELLKASIDKEEVGSKRWFLLQSLRAFAAYTVPGVPTDEGFKSYSAIFDQADSAFKGGATYELRLAINECVLVVARLLPSRGISVGENTSTTLLKAWEAYVAYLRQKQEKENFRIAEPIWTEAISVSWTGDVFLPLVEQALNDPTFPRNLAVMKVTVELYSTGKPERALKILEQAKPLLDVNQKADVEWFYARRVELLEEIGGSQDVLQAQEERVAATGAGHAKLLMMYVKNGGAKGFDRIFTSLLAVDANEREINDAADAMEQLNTAQQQSEEAKQMVEGKPVILLSSYLNNHRSRDVEQELRARRKLGYLLIGQNKLAQARAALAIEHLKPPFPSTQVHQYYSDIQKTLGSLAPKD